MGAWLSRKTHLNIEARDFFLNRFTEEELRTLIRDRPASEFFSWASPSFRKLDVDREALDEDQLIALMLEQPRLIRRPLIEIDGRLLPRLALQLVGSRDDVWPAEHPIHAQAGFSI